MTRESVRATRAARTKQVTAVPVTVTALTTHTVTVTLPGGASVTAPRGAGWTYVVGGPGWALMQEPAVIAVFPTA